MPERAARNQAHRNIIEIIRGPHGAAHPNPRHTQGAKRSGVFLQGLVHSGRGAFATCLN